MKYVSLLTCLCLFISAANAQDTLELCLGAGYGFSTGLQRLPDEIDYNTSSPRSKPANTSFGRGLHLNADATWWISSVFGFTAGGSYIVTTPDVKAHYESDMIDNSYSTSSNWHSRIAVAMAGIALKIPHHRLHPYMRMGVLLPVYSEVTEDADWASGTFVGSYYGTFKKSFRLRNTLGYTASAGIAPQLSKDLVVFAEANLQSLSILARRATLNSFTTGEVEQISNYNTNARETVYVKKTGGYVYSPDTPNQALTFSFPYSSVGVRIGISIKL